MKRKTLVALVVAASPLLVLAADGGGSCEYTTDRSARDKLTYCTQTPDEARCKAAAAGRATATWLEAHPARFQPGGDCTDGGKALKKAPAGKGAKPGPKATGKKSAS